MKLKEYLFAKAGLIGVCITAAGCQTITVVNDAQKGGGASSGEMVEVWNHTGIFGLVGYSGEFDTRDLCGGGWSMITTERGVLPSLAEAGMSIVSNIPSLGAAAGLAGLASFFWDPLTLKYQCASSGKSSAADATLNHPVATN